VPSTTFFSSTSPCAEIDSSKRRSSPRAVSR
jgi:hypothetical protein